MRNGKENKNKKKEKGNFVSRECILVLLRADAGVSNRGSGDEMSYTS